MSFSITTDIPISRTNKAHQIRNESGEWVGDHQNFSDAINWCVDHDLRRIELITPGGHFLMDVEPKKDGIEGLEKLGYWTATARVDVKFNRKIRQHLIEWQAAKTPIQYLTIGALLMAFDTADVHKFTLQAKTTQYLVDLHPYPW